MTAGKLGCWVNFCWKFKNLLPMKRVLVIGSGGSGKTTFSKKLAEQTGLPLYHLDALYWKPGWKEPEKAEWRANMDALARRDEWIIDGNYSGTFDLRMPHADLIVFFDIPAYRCIWNILKRRLQYARFTRPDMAPGCPETIGFGFLIWVWQYPKKNKPKVLEAIRNLKAAHAKVLIFNSYEAVDVFLTSTTLPSF